MNHHILYNPASHWSHSEATLTLIDHLYLLKIVYIDEDYSLFHRPVGDAILVKL